MDNYGRVGGSEQQVIEEYVEEVVDDEQYVVDDGQQYYEEYVEGGSANGYVPAIYSQHQQPALHYRARGGTVGFVPSHRTVYQPRAYSQQRVHQHYSRPVPVGSIYYPSQNEGVRAKSTASLVYTPSPLLARRENMVAKIEPVGYQTILSNFLSKPKAKSRKANNKRKPCNCNKSMCLKLYCDCFANGEFCLDCNCKDCHNNLEHEAERSRAIKTSLERNPAAFKPKIGVAAKNVGKTIDMERLHQKGCHCKRSNCLKNYCECYEAKVPCTERCKCQSCRNTDQDRHNKFKEKFSTTAGGLAQLAAAAAADSSRPRSGSPASEDEGSDVFAVEGDDRLLQMQRQFNPKTMPWFYMTEDVIEATTMCLVAQAKECESAMSDEELERNLLKEFGRCLEQIIESANACGPQSQQATSALASTSTQQQ